VHVWAAIFLGGAISGFPIFLACKRPGHAFTRHTIAVAQMLTSALLIHLTGGRIETHFHVFGSLAFLAFYRDWRVLVSATVVVALDHLLRGIFLPQSVFGVLAPSSWRWLEHAGWVAFEDIFLVISIQQSRRDMRQVAERQARLEGVNEGVEQRVRERTHDLQREVQERIETQSKLEETHKQLLQVSRQAGMAEVATGVLHNVGNVLNSVSVSATVVCERLRQSEVDDLHCAAAMLDEKNGQLAKFLTDDPKGKLLPEYLAKASKLLASERDELVSEMASVVQHIEHIKEIVAMQQSYAKVFGVLEPVPPTALRSGRGADAPGGLRGEYFANAELTGKPFRTRLDGTINFDLDRAVPVEGLPERYSVRWSGFLKPPAVGKYRLKVGIERCWDCAKHDAYRLWVDGKMVLDDDGAGAGPG